MLNIFKILIFIIIIFATFLIYVLATPTILDFFRKLPQKRIGDPINIRVGIINNPRFESLNQKQIEELLSELKKGVKEQFDVTLNFNKIDTENIKEFFEKHVSQITEKQSKKIQRHMFRIFEYNKENSKKINIFKKQILEANKTTHLEGITAAVRNQGFKGNYFGTSKKEVLYNIMDYHLKKLSKISKLKNKNDNILIDQNNFYNEFMYWDSINESQSEYDLIITNQLIASAESYFYSIPAGLRGGITTGVATKSKTPLNGVVVVSTFPFLSNISFFNKERGQNYSPEKVYNYIAWIGVHEFGHLLGFRAHNYNHSRCIMKPSLGFKYKEWYQEISKSGKCLERHIPYFRDYFLGN